MVVVPAPVIAHLWPSSWSGIVAHSLGKISLSVTPSDGSFKDHLKVEVELHNIRGYFNLVVPKRSAFHAR